MTATSIDPEKILRDLRDLWSKLGREKETAGGVLRACSMTLLVASQCEGDSDAEVEAARQTLGILMHDHPSRAIVLRARPGAGMDARVFAECWLPFGRHQQICAEGIEFTVDPEHIGEVAKLLVPLRVPDLPVVLWFCNAAALGKKGDKHTASAVASEAALFALAEKIIFDSGSVEDAEAGLAFLRDLKSKGFRVADLAWTRLTGWREAIAELFEDHAIPADAITAVDITHGGHAVATCALYLSTWLRSVLPQVRIRLLGVEGKTGLQSVALHGDGIDCSVRLADGGSIQVRCGDRRYLSLLPSTTNDALMREELSILGRDPVFDRVLA